MEKKTEDLPKWYKPGIKASGAGGVYQRHGNKSWVLIKRGLGFA